MMVKSKDTKPLETTVRDIDGLDGSDSPGSITMQDPWGLPCPERYGDDVFKFKKSIGNETDYHYIPDVVGYNYTEMRYCDKDTGIICWDVRYTPGRLEVIACDHRARQTQEGRGRMSITHLHRPEAMLADRPKKSHNHA